MDKEAAQHGGPHPAGDLLSSHLGVQSKFLQLLPVNNAPAGLECSRKPRKSMLNEPLNSLWNSWILNVHLFAHHINADICLIASSLCTLSFPSRKWKLLKLTSHRNTDILFSVHNYEIKKFMPLVSGFYKNPVLSYTVHQSMGWTHSTWVQIPALSLTGCKKTRQGF